MQYSAVGSGANADSAVLHVEGDAEMIQQLGHIINLFFAAGGVKRQGHHLKMVFGLAEVGGLLIKAIRIV